MNAVIAASAPRSEVEARKGAWPNDRLASIDALRGLTMVAMLFSNFLNDRTFHVADLPSWMRHATVPDTMTPPDVIWPLFTFLLGLSIPLAVEKRRARGQPWTWITLHALWRTASLMIIGIFTGTAWCHGGQARPLGMAVDLWNVLMAVGCILAWAWLPRLSGRWKGVEVLVRLCGAGLLVYLAAIYREGDDMHFMRLRWWILGTLAWGYLGAALGYLILRRQPAAILGLAALCVLSYLGDQTGATEKIASLAWLRHELRLGDGFGVCPAMALSGVLVGRLFVADARPLRPAERVLWILVFAAGFYCAGFFLRPLYGCSKAASTPTWALYCMAIACLFTAAFYLIVDVWGGRRCVAPLVYVGRNSLLAYLIHELLFPLVTLLDVDIAASGGWGIARSAVVAAVVAVVVAVSAWLRLLRLRL